MRAAGLGLALALCASAAGADVPVDVGTVVSPVYDAPGSQAEIARRGQTCMAQILKPGTVDATVIRSADLAGGVIVGQNAFEYVEKSLGMKLASRARSTVTLEAKDGRFRVTHSDVETFMQYGGARWVPAKVWRDKGDADPLKAALAKISDELAACVREKPADW